MLAISISGNDYNLPQSWEEITIEHCLRIAKVVKAMPEFLVKHYKEGAELTTEELIKDAPLFYGDVLCIMAGIPTDIMSKCLLADRTVLYKGVCERIVLETMAYPSEVEEIAFFDFKDKRYYLPEGRKVLGQDKPGADMSVIEFTEEADLRIYANKLSLGIIEVLPNFVSIIARPKGERYDENTCLLRAEQFKELPMSVAWSVFFSSISYTLRLCSDSLTSATVAALKLQQQQRSQASVHSGGTARLSKWVKIKFSIEDFRARIVLRLLSVRTSTTSFFTSRRKKQITPSGKS